ncbi:MAG: hypothetical protein NTX86_01885 [Candidatus Dependentiae bacterium]|nr:hypothetical protein [Candidatus Dependentiae bacterium]
MKKYLYAHKHRTMLYCFLLLPLSLYANNTHKALVAVPIIDLVGSPIQDLIPNVSEPKAYKALPLCGGNTNKFLACPRMHQLLFNEVVTIIEVKNSEALIHIPNFFYMVNGKATPQHAYWTPKKNLIMFKELVKQGVDLEKIPKSLSFRKKTIPVDHNTVTLIMPYTDTTLPYTFSAGTRFIKVQDLSTKEDLSAEALAKEEANNSPDITRVYAFDKKSMSHKELAIPTSLLVSNENKEPKEKIKQFVDLLKQWAHQKNGFIPYVWGGCSFTKTNNGEYEEIQQKTSTSVTSYFTLSDDQETPKSGMDCSGLIGRAAQISGIPYFFKNTATVTSHLKPLHKNEVLEEGDIIWIPGHVMIVSNIEKNMLTEARARLNNCHGKIQEIALNKIFKGINSYQELIKAFHTKQPLYRLDLAGNVFETITTMKLLKMDSVWQ